MFALTIQKNSKHLQMNNVTQHVCIGVLVLDSIENIVGRGENAGYQHFLFLPPCFQKPSSSASLNLGCCGQGLTR